MARVLADSLFSAQGMDIRLSQDGADRFIQARIGSLQCQDAETELAHGKTGIGSCLRNSALVFDKWPIVCLHLRDKYVQGGPKFGIFLTQ